MALMLFLDCEFTSLAAPRLISVALTASQLQPEFYGEVALSRPLLRQASPFTKKSVLPQLGRVGTIQTSEACLAIELVAWLEGLQGSLEVAYDYHADFDLFERLLLQASGGAELLQRITPAHVAYLWGDDGALAAAQQSWEAGQAAQGVGRHHALADARALACAFQSVHGG